jgi:hypothetical protein
MISQLQAVVTSLKNVKRHTVCTTAPAFASAMDEINTAISHVEKAIFALREPNKWSEPKRCACGELED